MRFLPTSYGDLIYLAHPHKVNDKTYNDKAHCRHNSDGWGKWQDMSQNGKLVKKTCCINENSRDQKHERKQKLDNLEV